MFLEVTALKRLSYEGQREPGDRFIMRRQHAKIFKAKGQVELHPETLRENRTLPPLASKETKVVEAPALVQKVVEDAVENTPEIVDNATESTTTATEETPVVKTSKKRKSKYDV
jgi:hypothetical protein